MKLWVTKAIKQSTKPSTSSSSASIKPFKPPLIIDTTSSSTPRIRSSIVAVQPEVFKNPLHFWLTLMFAIVGMAMIWYIVSMMREIVRVQKVQQLVLDEILQLISKQQQRHKH